MAFFSLCFIKQILITNIINYYVKHTKRQVVFLLFIKILWCRIECFIVINIIYNIYKNIGRLGNKLICFFIIYIY